jgi:hypothetical protein
MTVNDLSNRERMKQDGDMKGTRGKKKLAEDEAMKEFIPL